MWVTGRTRFQMYLVCQHWMKASATAQPTLNKASAASARPDRPDEEIRQDAAYQAAGRPAEPHLRWARHPGGIHLQYVVPKRHDGCDRLF